MFAPGVPQVMKDFHSTNLELASFVVSVYLLGYCFGPLLIAPLSEMYGRMIIYNVCNILYVVFTICCAVAPDLASLIVFRLLAGTAGSAPLTIGAGSISDMIRQEKRGGAMAAWALGPLLGPVIGPVGEYLCPLCSGNLRLTMCSGRLLSPSQRMEVDILGAGDGGAFLPITSPNHADLKRGDREALWQLIRSFSCASRTHLPFSNERRDVCVRKRVTQI